ncbi:MAG TPA: T9SS type A sorting domain-containing protein [Puia sp.]|nr:T9SS type A sorting domain-containing protein [Puia sp.]
MKNKSIVNRCLLVLLSFFLTSYSFAQLTSTHIKSFSPTSGTAGTLVAIKGSGFTGTTSVRFGVDAAPSFSVLSDTSITARVGAGSSGKVYVSGSHGQDSLAGFTYISPPPLNLTHITSFSPTSGSTGTSVAIRGLGFIGTTVVRFGSTAAQSFTVVSDTAITAVVGTGSSGNVFVSGSQGLDSLAGFTYTTTPPTQTHITSFSPTSGSTGTSVAIRGVGFTGTTTVSFGSTAAQSFTVLSDTAITAVVGTGSSGQVFVSGTRGFDSLAGFTYTPPLTSTHITSFSPTSGSTGTSIAIRGVGFTGTTAVSFGSTAAQSFTVLSDTAITAIVDSGSSGNVFVSGSHGFDSLAGFTYIATPAPLTQLTSLSVYPNPANGVLSVAVPKTAVASRFQLTDMMGKIARSVKVEPNVTNVKINIAGLDKGVYKLTWSDGVNYSYQTILILK